MSLPSWLKVKAPNMDKLAEMDRTLRKGSINTVCENAMCPNLGECFSQKTATFLIMGDVCVRKCSFCAVKKGAPVLLDESEPLRLSKTVDTLGLEYVVITSVTRDDLDDGGASHFALCIESLHKINKGIDVEVLTPDFGGSASALGKVLSANPVVYNHNIETVERLYRDIRQGADYKRSLSMIRVAKQFNPKIITKSSIMMGLGETEKETKEVINDLVNAYCDILTIGQYLSPSSIHAPVVRYYSPSEFEQIKEYALDCGFKAVVSGPLVRSSYNARKIYTLLRTELL